MGTPQLRILGGKTKKVNTRKEEGREGDTRQDVGKGKRTYLAANNNPGYSGTVSKSKCSLNSNRTTFGLIIVVPTESRPTWKHVIPHLSYVSFALLR